MFSSAVCFGDVCRTVVKRLPWSPRPSQLKKGMDVTRMYILLERRWSGTPREMLIHSLPVTYHWSRDPLCFTCWVCWHFWLMMEKNFCFVECISSDSFELGTVDGSFEILFSCHNHWWMPEVLLAAAVKSRCRVCGLRDHCCLTLTFMWRKTETSLMALRLGWRVYMLGSSVCQSCGVRAVVEIGN